MSDISFDEIIKMADEAHALGFKVGYAEAAAGMQAALDTLTAGVWADDWTYSVEREDE